VKSQSSETIRPEESHKAAIKMPFSIKIAMELDKDRGQRTFGRMKMYEEDFVSPKYISLFS
jgi:hypothetical protein